MKFREQNFMTREKTREKRNSGNISEACGRKNMDIKELTNESLMIKYAELDFQII